MKSKLIRKFGVNIKGEGDSGPSGGKMHPEKALEKGGKVVEQGSRRTGKPTPEKVVAKKKGK